MWKNLIITLANINEKKHKADLDVLMLTQGYRRFEWAKLLKDDFPPLTFEPERTRAGKRAYKKHWVVSRLLMGK